MKQELEYYYGLIDIEVHHKEKEYTIYKGNDKYIFKPCYRNYEELVEIYKILDNNYNLLFSRIMINRDNRLVTIINNTSYILLKIQVDDIRLIDFYDLIEFNNKNIIYEGLDLKKIYRTNWIDLWSRKLDYFEYQMEHLKDKYKILSTSINFFIGLGENAISYINQILNEERIDAFISIVHRRVLYNMSITDFYDPTEIIIDYKVRDISEYLKSLFLCGEVDYDYLDSFFRKLNFNKIDFEMLFGRLLFPSFYFDLYENIINKEVSEKDIYMIINKSNDYILFLKKIYNIIYKIYPIKKIDWI